MVTSVAELESLLGEQPPITLAKSIDRLDEHCLAFLAHSPFAVLGTEDAGGRLHSVALGGEPGALHPVTDTRIALPAADVPAEDGAAAGLVAFVPGYRETLRVNGRLRRDGDALALDVEEAFLHCAKCILRSKLWDDAHEPGEAVPGAVFHDAAVTAFLARSPFLTLATVDADGFADVSPKGEPAGFFVALDDHTLAIADRPGNRRTDTYRNLLANPAISVLAVVPGDDRVLHVSGTARLSTDAALRERFESKGNVPELALVVEADLVKLRTEPGLVESTLWTAPRVATGTLPKAAEIWTDHVAAGST
ncbi:pyridoxamine 5'-phosphate oxidase family protein [Rhodococcus rhodnii]|uniref:pyridoxamine 5'-phosphate oxidase family protein n=1 Tax=Rhodococcus rhodnii TaxID=38312 RepID=UPI00039F3D7D|nr:pyridoxamine 5'-phosphate oxidase family protein [Rhodococcus rhodnii]